MVSWFSVVWLVWVLVVSLVLCRLLCSLVNSDVLVIIVCVGLCWWYSVSSVCIW